MSATISIDGTDVTGVAIEGSSTRRLNRPSTAQVKIPMQESIGGVGSSLKVSFNGNLHHHGRVLLCETDTGEDTGYTVYNSTDPMELWEWRPVRADDGDFSVPSGSGATDGTDIIATYQTGPQILQAMLLNSIDTTAGGGGPPPTDAEGPIFLSLISFETGGVDLTGVPVDWPMTIMELTSLFISTGCLDVVITPTDPGGGVMGELRAYNGDYGTDLSGSVVFSYGTGDFNVSRLRWNQDMTNMCNKLWYYAGPRLLTPGDPAGDQHWCFNVTGTPGINNPLPDPMPNGADLTTFLADRITARTTYGTRMEIQIFDAQDQACAGLGSPERGIYLNRWETESWIRYQPRELIHITPTRETEIGGFDIGDIVGVEASTAVRGGFSGAQRVYEYTISWDQDGVLALSEIQTSANSDA